MIRVMLIRLAPKARFRPRGNRALLGNAVRDGDPKGSAESQTALDHPVKLRSADTLGANLISTIRVIILTASVAAYLIAWPGVATALAVVALGITAVRWAT